MKKKYCEHIHIAIDFVKKKVISINLKKTNKKTKQISHMGK